VIVSRSAERIKRRIRREIDAYEDDDLVKEAWIEFHDWEADVDLKRDTEADLVDAERQLSEHVVLSGEGRRRLSTFVFNKRWQERKPGRAGR
jgi:hypothetical protein